ncbi:MAG: methyltransferase domain-containing protein [Candidatus Liptonbacteria bacterium]|nr:methyltransferase domain-containing protein [Candidatus Liptonbacteria bacterium]
MANVLAYLRRLTRWIYWRIDIASPRSGPLRAICCLGRWEVTTGDLSQAGDYLRHMWRAALRQIPKDARIRKVLLLGLAIGDLVEILGQRYPACRILAVDYDPAVADLAERIGLFRKNPKLRFLLGDARDVVPRLQEKFDLVLVDIFSNTGPAAILEQEDFLKQISQTVSPRGWLLFNVYQRAELLALMGKFLSAWRIWLFRHNHLGLYRPPGNGLIGEPLPQGFVHPRQLGAYLASENETNIRTYPVQNGSRESIGWRHGPFRFEEYVGDEKPELPPGPPHRAVLWQPLARKDRPRGWFPLHGPLSERLGGFAELSADQDYWQRWTEHAQRHRRRWLLERRRYPIVGLEPEQFVSAFQKAPRLPQDQKKKITRRLAVRGRYFGENLKIWGATVADTGEVIGGLAVVDLPEISQSVHLAAFLLPEGNACSAGIGLIDHWYDASIKRGLRFLNFGLFWVPGEPREWQGFSRFKSQFGVHFLRYPRGLWRIV